MRVASVAPARHRKRKGGFFSRSNTDLERERASERERKRVLFSKTLSS
jgi:hypothetical protein